VNGTRTRESNWRWDNNCSLRDYTFLPHQVRTRNEYKNSAVALLRYYTNCKVTKKLQLENKIKSAQFQLIIWNVYRSRYNKGTRRLFESYQLRRYSTSVLFRNVCMYFIQNDVIMSLISKPHSWALLQNQSWTASNQSQGIQIAISSPRPGLEGPSGWDPLAWTNRRHQQPWERLRWEWKPGPEPRKKPPRAQCTAVVWVVAVVSYSDIKKFAICFRPKYQF
jgi:hypothetical protein